MKKILIICSGLIVFCGIGKAQNNDQERIKIIRSFLTDFYAKSEPASVFVPKYMHIEYAHSPDSIRLVQMSIDTLAKSARTVTQSKYDPKKARILPYAELKDTTKPDFGEGEKNVYAIKVDDEVIMYLFFRQNRIRSFYHFQKQKGRPGEPGFFLVF